jgi:hypothetical protein
MSAGAKPRLRVRLLAYGLIFAFCLAVLEFGSRLLVPNFAAEGDALQRDLYDRLYSKKEMDQTLPVHLERHGGSCLTYRLDKLYWDEWWGYAAKTLHKDCARDVLARSPVRVLLFGGSAMNDAEAPNYLSKIDYLSFGSDDRIASVNLAETGARLTNMVARFVHEGLDLKPNVAVFMDGFNEFNSVRYGREPGKDFYWIAGVKDRIENPPSVYLDKLIEKSAFAQISLLQSGLVRSVRVPNLKAPPSPDEDVRIYLRDREIATLICRQYQIQCIFILQPITFANRHVNANAAKVIDLHTRAFPHDAALYKAGFERLRMGACPATCIDASDILEDIDDAYFTIPHFTKNGGAKLGKLIHRAVIDGYERSVAAR